MESVITSRPAAAVHGYTAEANAQYEVLDFGVRFAVQAVPGGWQYAVIGAGEYLGDGKIVATLSEVISNILGGV